MPAFCTLNPASKTFSPTSFSPPFCSATLSLFSPKIQYLHNRPNRRRATLQMRITRSNFDPSVYLVTDRKTNCNQNIDQIVSDVINTSAKNHRVTFVQLRDKHIPPQESLLLAKRLRQITLSANVAFVINDDIHLASQVLADGVHLGQEDQSVQVARRLLGENAIVGVSASTEEEIEAAIKDGADYVGVGPVFSTSSKPDAGEPLGENRLHDLVKFVDRRVPVVAIGGIDENNAAFCKRAGADGVAVISAIMRSQNPQQSATRLSVTMKASLPS